MGDAYQLAMKEPAQAEAAERIMVAARRMHTQ